MVANYMALLMSIYCGLIIDHFDAMYLNHTGCVVNWIKERKKVYVSLILSMPEQDN